MKIYIEKIASNPAGLPAIAKKDYVPGTVQPDGYSLPIEYNVEGVLFGRLRVGECVKIFREKRNGIICDGTLVTTKVIELDKKCFKTLNSIYYYRYL